MAKGTITIRYMQEYLRHKQGQLDRDDLYVLFTKLTEEMGELASALIHGNRHATCGEDIKGSVEEELYDVLYYLLMLANKEGIDLETWIPVKEALNNRRYPSGIEFNPEEDFED